MTFFLLRWLRADRDDYTKVQWPTREPRPVVLPMQGRSRSATWRATDTRNVLPLRRKERG